MNLTTLPFLDILVVLFNTTMEYIDCLTDFGLTRQEAVLYQALLYRGNMTGYEIAKETGISRSNAYASLSSLVEKGAAYLIEGEATKYTPVEIKQFTKNRLEALSKSAEFLEKNAPEQQKTETGYITITGAENIRNKIRQMLKETQLRLYVMAPSAILSDFNEELNELVSAGKKVVILSDNYKLNAAKVYSTTPEDCQIRLITDSSYVLTGELTGSAHDTCLFSGQKNLVAVMKEALKNKITLLEQ